MTRELPVQVLIEAVPMPMLVINPASRVTAANAAARAVLGDAVGRHFLTVIRHPEPVALIEQVMAGGAGGPVHWRVTGPGRDTVYRGSVARVGEAGVTLAFEDTTDIDQAPDMRRDFVANLSHELRTPLTALLGFIETLRGPARDDERARERFLNIMEREALRMNRLVGDLLSLGRVEAEERIRPRKPVDLAALAAAAVTTLRGLAEAADVALVLHAPPDLPEVPGDADQLTQVLHNLLENAVKYGGPGKIVRLELAAVPADGRLGGDAVRIRVIDQGEGIAPHHIPRLTERFYRVDSHRSREQGGTGLGLAIVKHIVQRHRGRLSIDSVRGGGSTFEVSLPTAEAPPRTSENQPEQ